MNFCPNCGNQVANNIDKCPHCGYSLKDYKKRTAAQSKKGNISKQSVLALIFTIIFFPVGIFFIIKDLKDNTESNHILTYIACGILALGIIMAIFPSKKDSTATTTATEKTIEKSTETNTTELKEEPTVKETTQEIPSEEIPSVEASAAPTEEESNDSNLTTAQKQALKSADSYLSHTAFSYKGLIKQLEFEGFSTDDATFAADNCGADWNEQALKSAIHYLDTSSFSHKGLITQLEFEQFTTDQATYGADNCGADWNEQAVKTALSYLDTGSFSKDSLITQLEFEGFTSEQASYGADQAYK